MTTSKYIREREKKKYELHRRKSAIKRNTQRNAKHTSGEGRGIVVANSPNKRKIYKTERYKNVVRIHRKKYLVKFSIYYIVYLLRKISPFVKSRSSARVSRKPSKPLNAETTDVVCCVLNYHTSVYVHSVIILFPRLFRKNTHYTTFVIDWCLRDVTRGVYFNNGG